MKSQIKQLLTLLLSFALLLSLAACSGTSGPAPSKQPTGEPVTEPTYEDVNLEEDDKAGNLYTLVYTSGPDYDADIRPESHFLGASGAFSGMRMASIVVQVKFYDDGTFCYTATDNSCVDTSDERWMHRQYVWYGTYTLNDGVYTLSAPTSATLEFVGGSAYPPMAGLIGPLGSFTEETDPSLLEMFQPSTATVDGSSITFTLLSEEVQTGPQEGQIKVACIGDSITYGHGVSNWETDNYPVVLQTILGDGYYVVNYGVIGACVSQNSDNPYTAQNAYQKSLDLNPDIIIIMLGTNDSKAGNWTNTDTFIQEYTALLNSYLADGRTPKVYIGLCAEAYTLENPTLDYGIQPEIVDQIVEAIWTAAQDLDVTVVDIHALTTEHPEWFTSDGVHPDSTGAKSIAEAFAHAITSE